MNELTDGYIEAYIKKRIREDLRDLIKRELVAHIYGLEHYRDYYLSRSNDTPGLNFKEYIDKKLRPKIDFEICKNNLINDFIKQKEV